MKLKDQMPQTAASRGDALPLVLVLCTGNSCRSQIAEGFLKAFGGEFIEVGSAGSKPAGFVHPLAIKVMEEIGIDISGHRSKSVDEFLHRQVDAIITVCGQADEACPVFPGPATRYHWPFEDPAKVSGTAEEQLAAFRTLRDKMRPVFEAYLTGRKDGFGERERKED